MSRFAAAFGRSGFGLALLVLLLAFNVALDPARFAPGAWGTLIGLAAPLVGAALAATPAILGGRGGIDVSVGPAMGFANALAIKVLAVDAGVTSPWVVVPAVLGAGALIGLFNGVLAAVVRIQPIVATLGTYLILGGLTLTILPSPEGVAPGWIKALSGPFALLPLALVAAAWAAFRRLPVYDQLMAVGSDDRAAYTAGIPVTRVRVLSYVATGILAAAAGLMLTALIGSADPGAGTTYTLTAISAVALGGVSFAGGRGGLAAAAVGAVDLFLLQSALTFFDVSTYMLQVGYGAVLVAAVVLTALQDRLTSRRRHAA